jgi:type III pantothenate kinase
MILAVDIGNTNSCFALYREDECVGQWRLATSRVRTADEFTFWIESLLQKAGFSLEQIEQSIVACVVPSCRFAILSALESLLGKKPALISAELMAQIGVQVKLENPYEVGADRLINAYAAWKQTGETSIVLDFGTATTFDVVDETGAYYGGVIAPGINLSLEALHRAAAKLPSVEISHPAKAIGTSTESAMKSGIYFGYLGLIERIINEISAELGKAPRVIATGGLAPLFARNCEKIHHLEPDLTMRGLHFVSKALQGD